MAVGDISKREITCWGHVGSAAWSQRPVEETQAEVLASTHLLDGATVGGKLSRTPRHGEKVLNCLLSTFTYSNQASIPNCPLNVTLWGSAS